MLWKKIWIELADVEYIVKDFLSWDIIGRWQKNVNILDEQNIYSEFQKSLFFNSGAGTKQQQKNLWGLLNSENL